VTERVYEEKRKSKPMEYIQSIAILKYKHNIACSPRDHNVTSRNFETTEDEIDTEDKSPVLRTHRVKTSKHSKIQYCGPTHQKFKNNIFCLVYLDAEGLIKVTNQIGDVAHLKEFSRLMFLNGQVYSHSCVSQEDYLQMLGYAYVNNIMLKKKIPQS
jgi:hypothetical protein